MFQGLISLDLASHYIHMYTSLVMGDSQSHKVVDKKRSWLLNLYYSNKVRTPAFENSIRVDKFSDSLILMLRT
jgi:catabolite regulation protein CreA